MAYYEPNAPQLEREMIELRNRLLASFGFILLVTAVGIVGFMTIDPSAGFIRAFFMTAITLTTVGYGEEIAVDTDGARIFTAILILLGMGSVLYFVSTSTAFLLEGQLGHVFRRRRMQRDLERLDKHHIVCGAGTTAVYAARELAAVQKDVVIVAPTEEGAEAVSAEMPEALVVVGDPTDDDVLRLVGIDRAVGLVACTESDNENVVVTLTARQLNAFLRIVARVGDVDVMPKVQKVGANATVSPQHIGGLRLASELVRPTVVSFLDTMLRDDELNLRIDEVWIPEGSPLVGHPLTALKLEEVPEVVLLAAREHGKWKYNPPRSYELQPGLVLIFLGTPDDLQTLRTRAGAA